MGNGPTIKVWSDPWLLVNGDKIVHSPISEGMVELRVVDLLDDTG